METKGNTILITGGATGIGLALAAAFLDQGNEVIVCARTEENLRKAKEELPRLHTRRCDISMESERKGLHDWVMSHFPDTNVLVNNAGIQRMMDLRKGPTDLLAYLEAEGADEIDINFKALVYLSAHFIPEFQKRERAAIVNVSSGLGFIPIAAMPVYCATKAAVHSFSVSLRHQLRLTKIRVFEVIPPTVDTNLDKGTRGRRGQVDRGIPPREVARATLAGMTNDEFEIAVGMAKGLRSSLRENFDEAFSRMNRW
jgi:uncharacterized oxidoreductase